MKVGGVAFCGLMTAWLIRFEAFPEYFSTRSTGYRSLVDLGTLLSDQWTVITYEGAPIGYSHTQMVSHEEREATDVSRIQNRTVLQLKVLGHPQQITTLATIGLDPGHRLQTFDFVLSSRRYSSVIKARRVSGETFDVEIGSKSGTTTTQVDIPDDVVIYSPLTELAMRRLRPGQTYRIRTLDPVTLQVAHVISRAIGREVIEHRGESVSAMKLEVTYQGMSVSSWMDERGRILRQETPLGWVMEAATQEEAMSLELDPDAMQDMILATAVPIRGTLVDPAGAGSMRWRLENLHLDPEQLRSFRQEVTSVSEHEAEVVLYARPLPESGIPLGTAPAEMAADLESTPYVQADHPEIRLHARRVVDGATDSMTAARRIYDWVERRIEKNPTVSLPSALDVLRERVGDCNEHTYLYVALARAVGLPARIRVGLVYNQNALYYHAWPAVYVGEWVEMDPTLGQPSVGATHLALLEGELANQLELMKVMGRLQVEVLEETP